MSSTFPRVKRSQRGYDIEQVEDFLEDARRAYDVDVTKRTGIDSATIRRVAFDLVSGGYSPEHVDAALDRLDDAFARKDRERAIALHGEDAYFADVQRRAAECLETLDQPEGERFPRRGGFSKGYSVDEVDEVVDRAIAFLKDSEPLAPGEIRKVVFSTQRGGYDEDAVDEALDIVVSLTQAVQ